jgi:hypothetical protein
LAVGEWQYMRDGLLLLVVLLLSAHVYRHFENAQKLFGVIAAEPIAEEDFNSCMELVRKLGHQWEKTQAGRTLELLFEAKLDRRSKNGFSTP